MTHRITTHRKGFDFGVTEITTLNDITGIAFSITRLRKGENIQYTTSNEFAILLLEGELELTIADHTIKTRRTSLFDDLPTTVHLPADTSLLLTAKSDVEIATFETENSADFEPKIYVHTPEEHIERGFITEAALKFVRSFFDGPTDNPNSQLILGEVFNFPGRWSKYPPHERPQPELYHYRFKDLKAVAEATVGQERFQVHAFDTLAVVDEKTQAKIQAPGIGMYYFWVARTIPENPFTTPVFVKENQWTLEPGSL